MNLDDNQLELDKNNGAKDTILTSLIKGVQNAISNFIETPSSINFNNLPGDSIYVVRDINDEKLSIVNIETGKESDIYVTCSNNKIEELQNRGISNDNIYEISKEDLYSLNLGSNVTIKNRKCIPY